MAVQEHWDYLRTDTCFHAVLWLTEWPRSQVYPTFLAPLILTPGIDRRLTLLYEPIPTVKAMKQVQHDKTELISNAHDKAQTRAGREPGRRRRTHRHPAAGGRDQRRPRRHRLRRAARRQSGPTLDELTLAVGAIRQAAIQASCEARVLAGQQMQAFAAAALPLTRGF